MGAPLLSIIIPLTSTVPKELERNLSTIARNLTPAVEVLGLSWGCPKSSEAAFREAFAGYARARLVAVPRETTCGAVFNLGIRECQGIYFTYTDADNEMTPTTVERILHVIQDKPTMDLLIMTAVMGHMDDDMYFVPETPLRSFAGIHEGTGLRLLETLGHETGFLRCELFLGCYRRAFILEQNLWADESFQDRVAHIWVPQVYFKARLCSTMQRLLPSYWCVRRPIDWGLNHREQAIKSLLNAVLFLGRFYRDHRKEMPHAARRTWAVTTFAGFLSKIFNPKFEHLRLTVRERQKIIKTLWDDPEVGGTLRQMEVYLYFRQRVFCKLLRAYSRCCLVAPLLHFWEEFIHYVH